MKMKSHVLPKLRRSLLATLALVLAWPLAARAEPVSFKDDVFPILELRCLECHQPGTKGFEQSGLDLRTYEGLMTGTKHGPVVVPRSAFTSNLIVVVDHRAKARMPHEGKRLSKCERLLLRFWIDQGARNN